MEYTEFKVGDRLILTADYLHYARGWVLYALNNSNPAYSSVFCSVRYNKRHHPARNNPAVDLHVDANGSITDRVLIPLNIIKSTEEPDPYTLLATAA